MDGELYQEIINKIRTLRQRNELISDIDLLISRSTLDDTDNLSEIGNKIRDAANQEKTPNKYLEELKQALLKLPIVELTIAFSPSQNDINEVLAAIRSEINPEAIIDISVNPYLIAGAQIIYEGKYHDGSIASKLS